MRLDRVPAGTSIFIDSTIFIYCFTARSMQCREFLERCERGELRGYSTVVVLAETAHRLMIVEAVAGGLVSSGNAVRKLREKPSLVKKLQRYRELVERIPLMGIEVASLEIQTLLASWDLQKRHGLLVNDSLIAAAAPAQGLKAIASADRDFQRLGLAFYSPSDL